MKLRSAVVFEMFSNPSENGESALALRPICRQACIIGRSAFWVFPWTTEKATIPLFP